MNVDGKINILSLEQRVNVERRAAALVTIENVIVRVKAMMQESHNITEGKEQALSELLLWLRSLSKRS